MSINLRSSSGTVRAPLAIRGNDLYETPSVAVHALMLVEKLPAVIWEPACGPGAIVRVLRDAGHQVVATDLVDYDCPDSESRRDFLMDLHAPNRASCIVTNPPFKLATEFATHAKALVPEVHMLLRLAFLEGLRWERGLADGLANVHIFAPRLPFMHRHGFEGNRLSNSGMPFAWFVWRRGWDAPPAVSWLNWRSTR